jgi:hypothetical protein
MFSREHTNAMPDLLETMTGLITPGFRVAVRNMSSSDAKWPNAMRYVNKVMSYTLKGLGHEIQRRGTRVAFTFFG